MLRDPQFLGAPHPTLVVHMDGGIGARRCGGRSRLQRHFRCREVYQRLEPGFSGRCTAPLLVDKVTKTAVCNDSGIMLDTLYRLAGTVPGAASHDLKPAGMAAEIDKLNDFIYTNVNNAVYRCAALSLDRGRL